MLVKFFGGLIDRRASTGEAYTCNLFCINYLSSKAKFFTIGENMHKIEHNRALLRSNVLSKKELKMRKKTASIHGLLLVIVHVRYNVLSRLLCHKMSLSEGGSTFALSKNS